MKVLILNGSPRVGGNTATAIAELEKVFREEGVEAALTAYTGIQPDHPLFTRILDVYRALAVAAKA